MVGPSVHYLQTRRVMRAVSLVLIFAACNPETAAPAGPETVRERLAAPTQLAVSTTQSQGSIIASKRTSDGWSSQQVALTVEAGHLTATADKTGAVTLASLELAFAPVEIPSSVLGHEAQLTQLRLALAAPVALQATWSDDDDAHVAASLQLGLSWALTVDGTALPLGAPTLPPIPVTIDLSGDGAVVMAATQANLPGDLWTWADLVKLSDLALSLDAAN